FGGVATVCLKLFQVTQADIAVYGEKDFQQYRTLQQMVADLNVPLRLVMHPTVRESDGLAMASRNRYLSPEERVWAAQLPQGLQAARTAALRQPESRVGDILEVARQEIARAPLEIEYLELTSEADLVPLSRAAALASIPAPRLFAAVK